MISLFKKKVNRNAILIFGNQKTGTSAIASLLSLAAQKSATIDTKYLWFPYLDKIQRDKNLLEKHLNKHSSDFSKDLIKEPNLLYFKDELLPIFNRKNHILIVRDPYSNIKSILNRLSVKGNLEDINYENIDQRWRHVFQYSVGDNYISILANRWATFYNLSEKERDDFNIVRYEDFLDNKIETIHNLCNKFDFEIRNDISDKVDNQFQPKGNNKESKESFFGNENLLRIKGIVEDTAKTYGY